MAFKMWLSLYPDMDEEHFISFEDYKNEMLGSKITTNKSDEEILKEILEIRTTLGKGGQISGNI